MTLAQLFTAIANAIRTKKGTSSEIVAEDFPDEIASIPTGGGTGKEEKDINFYDYDGTLVESYTKTEFLALEALPQNPTHTGLTAQGWNWTLADAKTYVTSYGKLNIGQMYITDDGNTRIYIHLEEGRLSPYLGLGINGTVTVDWGDNSEPNVITGNSTATIINTQHVYSNAGNYVITISLSTGSTIGLMGDNNGTMILWDTINTSARKKVYSNAIIKIELGSDISSFNSYVFCNCYSLKYITIPNGISITNANMAAHFYNCYSLRYIVLPKSITTIVSSMFKDCVSLVGISIPKEVTEWKDTCFSDCYSLRNIIIPSNITSIGNSAFATCYSLAYAIIPNSVTQFGQSIFNTCRALNNLILSNSITTLTASICQACFSLSKIKIPSGVTTIERNAFLYCGSVVYYDFSNHITIPTLNNTNAFGDIASDCKIIVPDALYEDWIAANNWSTYASYIVKASEA